MYFWSIKKLKTQIIENNFNEKDRLKYFFLTNALMLLYFFFLEFIYIKSDIIYDQIERIISSLITLLTIYITYVANGKKSGSDFLGKFTSLYFVLNIKFFVLSILGYLLLSIILISFFHIPFESENKLKSICELIFFSITNILLLWRTYYHMKDIKRRQIS
ncbi:hypothetical protein [Fluviispira sanaruensis]|uniref:Uncharacterized protein n=1 Tax=Fluviispira sanaruensis TaxID=2493639 RepID=A0A4P2VHU9_FLUSA|nr:hypothetical protein [Fluviispira sanaruensis]BBH51918.1 hypothetical protein JCM31447_03470 [Fluviispira sanaruensis]